MSDIHSGHPVGERVAGEETVSFDREVDVLVLGTGAAGMTAALSAVHAGADVAIYDKAATVGGTSAVSGGIAWIPAHHRSPDGELTIDDALSYLRAQSLDSMDDDLVEEFVRTGEAMVDFVEAHSALRFEIADGFPDYKPELPGGRPSGGRSLSPIPFDLNRLGEWRNRITTFPADWSNVGFDAETRARLNAAVDLSDDSDVCVAGAALIGGLLRGLLDAGVVPETGTRGTSAHHRVRAGGRCSDGAGRQGVCGQGPPRGHLGDRRIRMGSGAGEDLPARSDARSGVTAERYRRRAADGDGARRRPRAT